jgi:Fe-S-cluster containining protein
VSDSEKNRVRLSVLDARIEARARATREAHPYWPCAEGCDACCRSLPHLPTISRDEWERLRDALLALPAPMRAEIVRRTRAPQVAPVTCPMLDRERGACLVYEARPIACRTYGFYTERDAGLYCERVSRAVEANAPAEDADAKPVIWGNGEAIAYELRSLGEPVSLREWIGDLPDQN